MIAMLMLATGALFAQGFGGGMGGNTAMVSTPKGLFALRAGVLAKINPATLKTEQVLEMFGAMPAAPAQGADEQTRRAYFTELQRRNAPAIMLVKDNSLLLLIGDGFARISQDDITKLEASASLKDPNAAADGGNNPFGRMAEPMPGTLLLTNTLVVMRSKMIYSINIADGKYTSAALDAKLQPQQMPRMGGGPGGGGAAGGGGRNGGGGNAGGGGGNN